MVQDRHRYISLSEMCDQQKIEMIRGVRRRMNDDDFDHDSDDVWDRGPTHPVTPKVST